VYNERDPGRLNVQDCETFISSSDESELERFHFLIAAICVYIYNYVNSSFANVYIYTSLRLRFIVIQECRTLEVAKISSRHVESTQPFSAVHPLQV
jgi:hypothetical protein